MRIATFRLNWFFIPSYAQVYFPLTHFVFNLKCVSCYLGLIQRTTQSRIITRLITHIDQLVLIIVIFRPALHVLRCCVFRPSFGWLVIHWYILSRYSSALLEKPTSFWVNGLDGSCILEHWFGISKQRPTIQKPKHLKSGHF